MSKKLFWLLGPIFVLALVGCGEAEDDEDTGTTSSGGSSTTDGTTNDTEVSLAIGSGSGTSFSSGALSSAIGSAELSAGGETSITASIVDTDNNNALYTGEVITVSFTSGCVEAEKASLSNTSVATSSGTATVTYTAQGCLDDTVVASFSSGSGTASASVGISIATAEVNAISFTGTDFTNSISYSSSSTSNAPSFTTVEFKLYDEYGNAVEGQDVNFSISGLDVHNDATLSVSEDTSDENGLVSTILNSGTSAANLRVIASFTTTGGVQVSTQSPPVAVNTGPVDVDSFHMGPEKCAIPDAFGEFNTTATFTAIAADRHNNPVADGTVISFWAEQGRIEPTCTTSQGSCSVTWWSGGGTPINEDDDGDGDADLGLATILAYTVGEDSFIEIQEKNGIFDVGETIVSEAEMFHDYEFNGTFDVGTDTYVDFNNSGSFETDNGGVYRGALCSDAAISAGHCAESSIIVWEHVRVTLSTQFFDIFVSDRSDWEVGDSETTLWDVSGGARSYYVYISDENGNMPPAGTKVSVESDDAEVELKVNESVNICPGGQGAYRYVVSVKPDDTSSLSSATITVESPTGNKTVTTKVSIQD